MKFMKIVSALCLSLSFLMMGTSCNDDNREDEISTARPTKERKDIMLTRSEQQIVDSNTKFAFDFFQQLNICQESKSGQTGNLNAQNIIFSPLSVTIDLSMLANATDDDLYKEFIKLMNLDSSVTRTEMNDLCRFLMDQLLEIDSQVDLRIANSVWTTVRATTNQSFINEITEKYNAFCQSVDFENQETVNIMNQWISEATDRHIKSIHSLSPNESFNRILLAKICNALYFNGEWCSKFNKDKTVNKTFYNINRTKSDIPMMNGKIPVRFYQDLERTLIGVPFGNKAYSLYFLIPDEGIDFENSISSFDFSTWSYYLEAATETDLQLYIPKFELSYDLNIGDVLSNMGLNLDSEGQPFNIPNMFEDDSIVLNTNVDISQICSFKVDENGATAVTSTSTASGIYISNIAKKFKIDRPFVFLIEEQSTGTILFMGKVVNL